MAFLEVITRVYRRPTWLENNQASLMRQTDPDWVQTLLVDEIGRGCAWANAQLATVDPIGEYVWVLDDDDYCVEPGLVAILKSLAAQHDTPPAILMRTIDEEFGELPPDSLWRQKPVEGAIGSSHIFTRADVWLAHRARWATMRYAADYDFIASVWGEHSESIIWHDTIVRAAMRISHGAPEVSA
jgi:hypothetical protein